MKSSRRLPALLGAVVIAACSIAMPATAFTAAVLGATGNVGREVVKELVRNKDCTKVVLLNRRQITDDAELTDGKIVHHVVNVQNLQKEALPHLKGVDVGFVAMGVGQPSKCKNKEEVMHVDCDLPVEFAKAAKEAGSTRVMVLLTAVGADISASYSRLSGTGAGGGWYNHVKGKVEKEFADLGFQSFAAFRPATLVGNSNTPGFLNWLAPKLDFVLPSRYNSICIAELGAAMVNFGADALKRDATAAPSVSVLEGEPLFAWTPSRLAAQQGEQKQD